MAFSSCCYCCSSVISSMIPSRVKDNLKSSAIVSWHGCSRIQLQHICYLQKTSLTCKRLIQMEGRLQCYYFSFKRTKMKSHHMNKELVDGLEEKLSDSFSGNWREDIFNNRLHQMLGLGEWFLQIYGLKLLSNYKNLIELQRSKKLFKMIGYISLIFSLTTLVLITSISTTRTKSLARALTEENQLFLEAWKTIDRAYIDKTFNGQAWFRYREDALRREPMNTREETYAAIRRMLASLGDPFTRFLEPEKFKSLRSSTTGSLTGVGVELGLMDGDNNSADLVVISCIGGGPADHAGILPGDRITAVNGTSTKGIGLYDAAELLQGPENSVIKLTFQRGDSGLKDVILKREKITLDPVSWHICDFSKNGGISPRIGYIKLARFNQNASGAVRQAIEELRERKVTVYVLDLRNNSGGLFPEGVKIAKIWLDKGVIVYICDSKGVRDIYDTDGTEAIATSEPLIVLVNKGTASASEILAAALHDNKRAVLLGEKTYGKGKIQSVFELSDGSGMVVTVARYETPAHTDIDKVGVSPDYQLPEAFPVDGDDLCKCIQETNSACSIFTSTLLSNQSR